MLQTAKGRVICGDFLDGAMPSRPMFPPDQQWTDVHQRIMSSATAACFVAGVGYKLPDVKNWVSNRDLFNSHRLRIPTGENTNDPRRWVLDKTGIAGRYHDPDLDFFELAIGAGDMAVKQSGLETSALSKIIVSTSVYPCDQQELTNRLSRYYSLASENIILLNKSCSSIIFQLKEADDTLKNNPFCNHILLIGVDQGSKFTDFTDPKSAILFGDGAGALVISRKNANDTAPRGLYHVISGSRPNDSDKLFVNDHRKLQMNDGPGILKIARRSMQEVIPEILGLGSVSAPDVDHVLLHQANLRLPDFVCSEYFDQSEASREKVPANIRHIGNTGAASPYLLIAETVKCGRLNPGHTIVVGAVGMGMHYGAALLIF